MVVTVWGRTRSRLQVCAAVSNPWTNEEVRGPGQGARRPLAHPAPSPERPVYTCPTACGSCSASSLTARQSHGCGEDTAEKTVNSTNLVFVFGSGCLSTGRVPDGGAWGQIPRREVVSVTTLGESGWGAGGSHTTSTRPAPPRSPGLPLWSRCWAGDKQTTGSAPGDSAWPRATTQTHHRELTAPTGGCMGPLNLGGASGSEETEGAARATCPCSSGWGTAAGPHPGHSWLELGRELDSGTRALCSWLGGRKGEPQVWGEERGRELGARHEAPTLGLNLSLIHLVSEPPPASVSPPASSAQPSTSTATRSPSAGVFSNSKLPSPGVSDFPHLQAGPVTAQPPRARGVANQIKQGQGGS